MIKWRRAPRATWTKTDPSVVDALAPAGAERPDDMDPVMHALSMGAEDEARARALPVVGADDARSAGEPEPPGLLKPTPRRGLLMDDLGAIFDAMPPGVSVPTIRTEVAELEEDAASSEELVAEIAECPGHRGEDVIVYGWEAGADAAPEVESVSAPEEPGEAAARRSGAALETWELDGEDSAAVEDIEEDIDLFGELEPIGGEEPISQEVEFVFEDELEEPAPAAQPTPDSPPGVEPPGSLDEELRQALAMIEGEDYGPELDEFDGGEGSAEVQLGGGDFELEIVDYELTGRNLIDDEVDWGALEFQGGHGSGDPAGGQGWVSTSRRAATSLEQVELPEPPQEEPTDMTELLEDDGPVCIHPEELELIEEGDVEQQAVIKTSKILGRNQSICTFEEHLAALEGPALDPVHLYLRSGLPVERFPEHREVIAAILKASCDYHYYKPLIPDGLAGHFRGYYATFRECLHHLEEHVPPRGEDALSAAWDEAWNQIEGALPAAERQRRVA